MTRLLGLVVVLCSVSSPTALASDPTRIVDAPITWLGLDYSRILMLGEDDDFPATRSVLDYPEQWNDLFIKERMAELQKVAEVVTPSEYMGDVIGDLNSRRGKVGGMTQRGEAQVIGASVPLGEMFGYSTTLRSTTQGRAVYTMQFSHYAEVPKSKAEEIVSKVKG